MRSAGPRTRCGCGCASAGCCPRWGSSCAAKADTAGFGCRWPVTHSFAVFGFAVIDNRRGTLTAAYLSFPFLLLFALTVSTGLLVIADVRRILAVEHTLQAEN